MKKIFNLTLGIVTSIGGFVEVGSISTAAQAGAEFGFSLLWAIGGIVLAVRGGQPPRLDAILIGPIALGYRLHPTVGRLVTGLERRLGLDAGRPVRVEFGDIETVEHKVRIRLAIGETTAEAVEQRLRAWVVKLAGSR